MLVQLNRVTEPRDRSVTATGVPIDPTATDGRPHPVVAVFGGPGRVGGLQHHLPGGWSLRYPAGWEDVSPDEIVLLAGTTVTEVGVARSVLPARTRIVAVLDEDAAPEVVAGVLTAGADVCVRGRQPAILAGHLIACRRRQIAERWAGLNARSIRA